MTFDQVLDIFLWTNNRVEILSEVASTWMKDYTKEYWLIYFHFHYYISFNNNYETAGVSHRANPRI